MKKIGVWCLVALLSVPNMALALEGIRVFDLYANPGLLNERVEVWSGCPVLGDSINTDCLADKAYDFAQSNGAVSLVPLSNQDRESYKDLFLRWNDLGPTMSIARFMRKATGTGFYLPQGRGRATSLSLSEWTTIRGEVDLLQQQMLTLEPESAKSMRARIDVLETRLGGVDTTTSGILGTLTTLEAMVKNIQTLSPEQREAQIGELKERLSGFEDRLSQVEVTKADKSEVASLEARVKTLENPGVSTPVPLTSTGDPRATLAQWLATYWWVFVLVLLVALLAWFLNRKKPDANKGVTLMTPVAQAPAMVRTTTHDEQFETLRKQVHDPEKGVLARVGQLEDVIGTHEQGMLARLDQLDTAVTQLRTDYDYLLKVSADGLRMVGTPDQTTLDALAVGKYIDLPIEGDEGVRTVRIVRGTFENEHGGIEDRLYVYGVTDVNNGVSVDSARLSRSLLRAVKEWRVVGIDDLKVGLSPAAYKRTPRKPSLRKTPSKAA